MMHRYRGREAKTQSNEQPPAETKEAKEEKPAEQAKEESKNHPFIINEHHHAL